jgi:hypothetical protein
MAEVVALSTASLHGQATADGVIKGQRAPCRVIAGSQHKRRRRIWRSAALYGASDQGVFRYGPQVTAVFADGVDIYFGHPQVNERTAQVLIGVGPPRRMIPLCRSRCTS